MENKVDKRTFVTALQKANLKEIVNNLDKGNNVNLDYGGIRAFDICFFYDRKKAKEGRKKILANPNWDPNYLMTSGLTPVTYAIAHKQNNEAIAIINHPRFDRKQLPQVKAFAELKKAAAVIRYLSTQHIR